MRKCVLLLFFAGLLIALQGILGGCSSKKPGYGSEDLIIALADSVEWEALRPAVSAALERQVYTPQPESLLRVRWVPPEKWGAFKRYHSFLVIGTLSGSPVMQQLFKSMLSPTDMRRVEQDSSFLFKKDNPWAFDQLLLVVVANDTATLTRRMQENADRLYGLMLAHVREVMTKQMFGKHEQKALSEELLRKYGWAVRIQHDYHPLEKPGDRIVWLRRIPPERWFLVHWEESDDPSQLTPEWCLKKRQWIGESFYTGERIVDGYTKWEWVDFDGRRAIEMWGLWEDSVKVVGGPFHVYAFYDHGSARLFLIDMACFAPGERKMPYMRQMDVMARTFRTRQKGMGG
ncbi:MAG: DUF4837 family protein [bacterium]|nr:DUF4837 family protein [candidate division KSB1 bacterium]MDH7558762.1 DUF4837 family protein [bacterium]